MRNWAWCKTIYFLDSLLVVADEGHGTNLVVDECLCSFNVSIYVLIYPNFKEGSNQTLYLLAQLTNLLSVLFWPNILIQVLKWSKQALQLNIIEIDFEITSIQVSVGLAAYVVNTWLSTHHAYHYLLYWGTKMFFRLNYDISGTFCTNGMCEMLVLASVKFQTALK